MKMMFCQSSIDAESSPRRHFFFWMTVLEVFRLISTGGGRHFVARCLNFLWYQQCSGFSLCLDRLAERLLLRPLDWSRVRASRREVISHNIVRKSG
ncbi:hypothetical protein CDAR_579981 [Caerostris darwini]|uniref:Uncharacterized protein n=1 Tax=Caerostris darwini TaxID=1538125 RepID=A0AAV4RIV9_9ARAC|nr:hypothetical protein CDAR_579981 [Caerostris darwini]